MFPLVKHIWFSHISIHTSYGCRLENYIQAYMLKAAFQLAWTPPLPPPPSPPEQ